MKIKSINSRIGIFTVVEEDSPFHPKIKEIIDLNLSAKLGYKLIYWSGEQSIIYLDEAKVAYNKEKED